MEEGELREEEEEAEERSKCPIYSPGVRAEECERSYHLPTNNFLDFMGESTQCCAALALFPIRALSGVLSAV